MVLGSSLASTPASQAAELSPDLHEISELWDRTGVSDLARAEIPASLLQNYRDAAQWAKDTLDCDLPWTVLAGVGWEETKHGKFNTTSFAGAKGPMQFLPGTWRGFGVDGDGDGIADIWNAADSTAASANYLCELGAGLGKDDPRETYDALQGYNRGPAKAMHNYWRYSDEGLAKAWAYGAIDPDALATVRFPTRAGAAGDWNLGVGRVDEADAGVAGYRFGQARAGDVGLLGDWNGDGTDTIGVFRRESRRWLLTNDNLNVAYRNSDGKTPRYGSSNAHPIVGDWDGDRRDNLGYVTTITDGPRAGQLRWRTTTGVAKPTTEHSVLFGRAGDHPVVGDWNGDGVDTFGVFRPSTSEWLLTDDNVTVNYRVANGSLPRLGSRGDLAVVGDWDGDGTDSIGVVRTIDDEAVWFLADVPTAPDDFHTITTFGTAGDTPLVGNWL